MRKTWLFLAVVLLLGCGEGPQEWEWVQVADYGGITETNAEQACVYVVDGPNPELWMTTALGRDAQKIAIFQQDGEQKLICIRIYDFTSDGVVKEERVFKYEKGKVRVQLAAYAEAGNKDKKI